MFLSFGGSFGHEFADGLEVDGVDLSTQSTVPVSQLFGELHYALLGLGSYIQLSILEIESY